MSGRVGSITTDIVVDGLVFNMDAANRASFLPIASNTQGINTINTSQKINSATSDVFDSSEIVPSLLFGGVDDYMTLSSGLTVSSFTTEVWIKTDHVNDEGSQNAYTDNLTGGTGFFTFFSLGMGGANNQRLNAYASSVLSNLVLSTNELNDDIWHSCICTFENGTLKSYIDGVLDKTHTGITEWSTSTLNTIGRYYTAGIRYYTGTIGSLRVYNRALAANEVLHNYNALKYRMGYVAPAIPLVVSYLVIAGGGGGGADNGSGWGGGGGAGGYRNSYNNETSGGNSSSETPLQLSSATNYTVTVGEGGSGTSPNGSGDDSVFSTITSIGGGGGGQPSPRNGENGGSGGGAAHSGNGGSGTSNQGLDGADGANNVSGGGGGASQAGGNPDGGDGLSSSITGTAITRAGGGGGTNFTGNGPGNAGAGGDGGGGTGGRTSNIRDAVANTGGGGGGGIPTGNSGGTGGSGIVILRYPSSYTITVGAGLTSTTSTAGTDKVTIFTAGTGNVSFN